MDEVGGSIAAREERGGGLILPVVAFFALVILAVAIVLVYLWSQSPWRALSGDQRYAVVLVNNQIFFGRPAVSLLAPRALRLTDVYYVQTQLSPESRASTNILVKRGNEWHGPGEMQVNADHVLMVEPVGEGSKVDELIRQLKAEPAAQN